MRTILASAFALSAIWLAAQQPAAAPFLGNKESKVVHLPTCKLVVKIKPENKVPFATREEAVAAGYSPCKICLK